MKRHSRGRDLLQRALNLSGISDNNMLQGNLDVEVDLYDQDETMFACTQEVNIIQKLPFSSTEMINHTITARDFESDFVMPCTPTTSIAIATLPPQEQVFNEDETMKNVVHETIAVIEKSPCSSPSTLNPRFLDETIHPVLNNIVTSSNSKGPTMTLESCFEFDEPMGGNIQIAACSSPSPLISTSIFLHEKTGEFRNHDLNETLEFNCSDNEQDCDYEPDLEESSTDCDS
ncbi:unnamed protein product [Arctia plantaginis]|uniref:Uncharacterized protein n=1 Tax=Arctia plantaginis TaxID=874455 RepID=A0A8S1AVK3_ARCPL|nr:unnamed protein product [Arctia plantaginis]